MKEYTVIVPVINGIPFLNAIGVNETEAAVNLDLIFVPEKDLKKVKFVNAKLEVDLP